ncbi:MAG: helix-turn-helix transcriptional regulator [Agathobacter sp.]|nr:helix-turn-helix transcriptional regulator [Agathobacter sp.]
MNAEYTGKKIAELRKEKNLTQKDLADQLHVTDKAVSKWERGVNFPDLGLMEKLADALDTTPSILLGLENSTKEEIVTSFAEISNQQSEEAAKDIQKIGWVNLFAGVFLIIFMYFINVKLQRNGVFIESQGLLWLIYGLIVVVTVGAIYILRKYKAIKKFELLETVLAEIIVADVIIFLAIQLFTGSNPIYMVSAVLIAVACICMQLLFYRVMKPQLIKALPLVLSVCWLCWGVLLKLAQASWVKTSIWDMLVFSVLPFICCFATWFICRKRDAERESLLPSIKLFAVVLLIVVAFVSLFAQDLLAKTYVKVFHKHLETYAEELLDKCEDTTSDQYGFWKVTCYPEDELVEFHTGGAGLVANSTYLGFYYSPDNTHKVFQGADVPLNVNKNLADWYGEGDNWGKSTRLMDKWFWFEASF